MTWSIIFRERDSGRIAIAVATKFFAVGARVPYVEPQKGAICTQALLNPLYGRDGLSLIREGVGAQDIVRLLTSRDAGRNHRQLHVLCADGTFAAHTGSECVPWCGHWVGDDFSVAGNMLAGPQVVSETVRFFRENSAMPLPRRLINALKAGEKVGGDKRGKQSAALVIYGQDEYSELDLRVDDHVEPLLELARLEAASRERWTHFRGFLATRGNPAGVFDRAIIDASIEQNLAEHAKAAE
ncbi:MAG TPA: DUF1028 domain-containing protein [Reyranella sp.]|nr:DUF1028 domain-containing protein [Reyranella sp.]